MKLDGRTCVFAGATGAIGRGAVKALAARGMNVVMVTHNPDGAQEVVELCRDLRGKVTAVRNCATIIHAHLTCSGLPVLRCRRSTGVSPPRSSALPRKPGPASNVQFIIAQFLSNQNGDRAAYEEAKRLFGSVDVILCTTGGLSAAKPIEEITAEDLNGKLVHQVTGPFMMAKEAILFLKESAAGRIIFLSSAGAQDGFAGESMVDSIARAGTISMTYCLARELASDGITVNCIARSGMINDHEPQHPDDYDVGSIQSVIPVGHLGTAEEFGALVEYLASEESAFMTGQVISLSGGLHIG